MVTAVIVPETNETLAVYKTKWPLALGYWLVVHVPTGGTLSWNWNTEREAMKMATGLYQRIRRRKMFASSDTKTFRAAIPKTVHRWWFEHGSKQKRRKRK